MEALQDLRKKSHISIGQLCLDSHVSTRTFAKFTKKTPVNPECCVRLVQGICYSSNNEEFMEFWMKLGEWIYQEFSEK